MQVTRSKCARLRGRQLFGRDRPIFDCDLAFQRVQLRHIEHRLRQIDPQHVGAAARHRLAQDSAAATHVEHARTLQALPPVRCSAGAQD